MTDKPQKEPVYHCTHCKKDLTAKDWQSGGIVKNARLGKDCPYCGSPVFRM